MEPLILNIVTSIIVIKYRYYYSYAKDRYYLLINKGYSFLLGLKYFKLKQIILITYFQCCTLWGLVIQQDALDTLTMSTKMLRLINFHLSDELFCAHF